MLPKHVAFFTYHSKILLFKVHPVQQPALCPEARISKHMTCTRFLAVKLANFLYYIKECSSLLIVQEYRKWKHWLSCLCHRPTILIMHTGAWMFRVDLRDWGRSGPMTFPKNTFWGALLGRNAHLFSYLLETQTKGSS